MDSNQGASSANTFSASSGGPLIAPEDRGHGVYFTRWIFGGMVLGVGVGLGDPTIARQLEPLSTIFLRLIQSIIAPLVFGILVHSIAEAGRAGTVGRVGLKALVLFELFTTFALLLGLATANLVRPGKGMRLAEGGTPEVHAQTTESLIEHVIPTSVIQAMAHNDVLQIVVFSVLFGVACGALNKSAEPIIAFADSLAKVMFKYTDYVMYFAPVGVAAALASTVGVNGVEALLSIGKLVAALYATIVLCVAVLFGVSALAARIPIRPFFQAVRDPVLIGFATSASGAALPTALHSLKRLGVPECVSAFVLPLGYTFNLIGTSVYLPLATLFIAQAAELKLSFTQQLLILITLKFASKGVASVPRAALVMLATAVTSLGLPIAGVSVLIGVDAVMDMARTAANVFGNSLTAAVVARWEGVSLTKSEEAV